jgi:hypothetical protein
VNTSPDNSHFGFAATENSDPEELKRQAKKPLTMEELLERKKALDEVIALHFCSIEFPENALHEHLRPVTDYVETTNDKYVDLDFTRLCILFHSVFYDRVVLLKQVAFSGSVVMLLETYTHSRKLAVGSTVLSQ